VEVGGSPSWSATTTRGSQWTGRASWRLTKGQRFPVDFYASADAALAVAAALDGQREMPVQGLPRGQGDQGPARADGELSTRGAYFSRRVSADPPSYVTRNGRWRETKVPRYDDPRFSASRPWMLERLDGEAATLVDFSATSDLAFVVAAALDGKQVMPIDGHPRPMSVAQE